MEDSDEYSVGYIETGDDGSDLRLNERLESLGAPDASHLQQQPCNTTNRERTKRVNEAYDQQRHNNLDVHLSSLHFLTDRRKGAADAEVQRLLEVEIPGLPARALPCDKCGECNWSVGAEVMSITLVSSTFVRDLSNVPKHLYCETCRETCRASGETVLPIRINPLYFGYFPANPTKQVRARMLCLSEICS